MIYFDTIRWLEQYVEKIERKHRVSTEEVEEALYSYPYLGKAQNGRTPVRMSILHTDKQGLADI